jgi:hypothetical protein
MADRPVFDVLQRIGVTATFTAHTNEETGAKTKGLFVLYQLWDAAKRRPTRTMLIIAAVLIIGAVAHMALCIQTYFALLRAGSTHQEGTVTIKSATPILSAAWNADLVVLACGVLLLFWARCRAWAGKR